MKTRDYLFKRLVVTHRKDASMQRRGGCSERHCKVPIVTPSGVYYEMHAASALLRQVTGLVIEFSHREWLNKRTPFNPRGWLTHDQVMTLIKKKHSIIREAEARRYTVRAT